MATAASESIFKVRWRNPSSYSGRILGSEWNEHRLFITYLHHGGVTRSKMLKILRICRVFSSSEYQLNSRLAAWDLKVYKKSEMTHHNKDNTSPARIKTVHNLMRNRNGRPLKHIDARRTTITEDTTSFETFQDLAQLGDASNAENGSPSLDGATAVTSSLPYRYQSPASDRPSPSQEYTSLYDLNSTAAGTTSQGLRRESDLDPSDPLHPVCSIAAIALLAEESYGVSSSDTLTDVGQLLYTCRLFLEASAILDKSYQQLSTQANVSNMRPIYCRLDAVPAHRYGLHTYDSNTATMTNDMETMLAHTTIYFGQTGHSYRKDIIRMLQDLDENVNWFSSNIPIKMDLFSELAIGNSCTEWLSRHGDLVWRCAASQYLFDTKQVLSELQCWIIDLEQESSRIWQILRDCSKALHMKLLAEDLPYNEVHIRSDILHTASALGCFLVRDYLEKIFSQKLEPMKPLSDKERLARIVSFKMTIRTCLVLATWITNSESTIERNRFYDPTVTLMARARSILKLPLEQRAHQFLQVHKDTCYIRANEREHVIRSPEIETYIFKTAELVANASVHIKRAVQYTYKDPIVGKRSRPQSSSTHSFSSMGSMRKMAKRLRTQSKEVESIFSIDELSDKMSTTSLKPELRFSVVTGISSNPSWRLSMSDGASVIPRSSKRSSLTSTKSGRDQACILSDRGTEEEEEGITDD